MKMKVRWFTFKKQLVDHYLKQNNSDLFFKPAPFSWNEMVRSWSPDQDVIFLKLRTVSFWTEILHLIIKEIVVAFTAHLSVTIKRFKRYKQKVVLAAMLEGKSVPSNMATCFVEKSNCIKISPVNASVPSEYDFRLIRSEVTQPSEMIINV